MIFFGIFQSGENLYFNLNLYHGKLTEPELDVLKSEIEKFDDTLETVSNKIDQSTGTISNSIQFISETSSQLNSLLFPIILIGIVVAL